MTTNRERMQREAMKPNGARVGIPARRMEFRHPETTSSFRFYDDNVLASSLFAVFSAIFPPGERFFVETVRRYRDAVPDEPLSSEVTGFMGQESIHGRQHEKLNEWLVARGYDVATPERLVRLGLNALRRLPPSQQLACTTFMEHFTAHLAEQLLVDEDFRRGADPELLGLWLWHGLEELEHKSAAFDVHRRVSAHQQRERLLAGPLVLATILPGVVLGLVWVVARQRGASDLRAHRRGLAILLGRRGFLTPIFPHLRDYFAKDFHPSARDTKALEEEWRERLFGPQGTLVGEFVNRATIAKLVEEARLSRAS